MKILIPDNVSTKTNVFDILKERGFIEQCTHEDEIRDMLGNEKIKFYIGFDPTADSLHIGHFMQIIIMLYMQKFGHTPVVLTGGGTGMVGDPSGRTDMRQFMTPETVQANCDAFTKLFAKYMDFDEDYKFTGENYGVKNSANKEVSPGKAISLNNATWLLDINYINFIRDIGRHFSVNTMLRADCYKQRLEEGLTFLEMNYMLMQSYDFMVMARDIDVRKCLKMLTFLPLDEIAALVDVEGSEINKAKEVLAFEITKLVHGEDAAKKALDGSRAAFQGTGDMSNIPHTKLDKSLFEGDGMGVIALLKELTLIKSNSEGLRLIDQGGVKINEVKISSGKHSISLSDFKDGKLLVQKGKKVFHMAEI